MKYCKKCNTHLEERIEKGILECPNCGYSEKENLEEKVMPQMITSETSIPLIETDKLPNPLPATTVDCPACGNNNAYWWLLQTDNADEPSTQFFQCTKCNHRWRNTD